MLSPWPCRAVPPGLFHRASLLGLAREKLRGATGTTGPGAALRQPGRPARICLPYAALPGAGQAGAGEPRHREWQSRDGQSCLSDGGGPEPAAAQATAGGHRGPSVRHLRELQQRQDPAVRAGTAAEGAGGCRGRAERREPCCGLQPSAACFHSFPAPVSRLPLPESGRGASHSPLSGAPAGPAGGNAAPASPGRGAGPQHSLRRQKCFAMRALLCQFTFVALFIFLNKLLVICGLSLAFFSSLPPATC